jgi:hypothetical protein
MNAASPNPWPTKPTHDTRREGVRLGVILATATWSWLVVVDAAMGRPFHTFAALGGAMAFTIVHYLLNIVYGIALLAAVHGAARAPSLMLALVFGSLLFEVAMAMLTAILVQYWLGEMAWVGVFGGSLIATALAAHLLMRTHPLVTYLHRAEAER